MQSTSLPSLFRPRTCLLPVVWLLCAPIAIACDTGADCDDGNPCTNNVCDDGECSNPSRPDFTTCADELFCNGTEVCNGGICLDNADPCPSLELCDEDADVCLQCFELEDCDLTNPCVSVECNDNQCVETPINNGLPCPDGVFCNGEEECLNGVCRDGGDPCIGGLQCDEEGQACISAVNLQWQPSDIQVEVGSIVNLALIAAVSPGEASISAMDVNLEWDPAALELLGIVNDGPYEWLLTLLPTFGDCTINATLGDGTALYRAFSQFGNLPVADADGLHVTTFQFEVLADGPPAIVRIASFIEADCPTIVVSGEVPGLDIKGVLNSAVIRTGSGCALNGECADLDLCTFDVCTDGDCSSQPAVRGDVSSADGSCGPDGSISVVDIFGILDAFRGIFNLSCDLNNYDLADGAGGCEPDGAISIADIFAVLDAFQGIDPCCGGAP